RPGEVPTRLEPGCKAAEITHIGGCTAWPRRSIGEAPAFHPRRQMTATVLERVPLNPQLLASLRQRLGDRLSTSAAVLEQHGKDESYHAPSAPDAVAFAHSTEEVSDRSEEHTSELQSPDHLVCRLLLEKKKKTQ